MMRRTILSFSLLFSCIIQAEVPFPQIAIDDQVFHWQAPELEAEYLVFGSQDPEFALNDPVLEDPHLLTVLDRPELPLDLPLPYCRLIARFSDGTFSEPSTLLNTTEAARSYPKFTQAQWEAIASYLLPDAHPAKEAINKIFSKARISASQETLKEAGFTVRPPGSGQTIVIKHSKLSNVIIKLFTDDQEPDDFKNLYDRILGAEVAKEIIRNHQYGWLFKVPRKWFYILPETPAATGPYPKQLILVVEDMKILPKEENYSKWSSSSMTKEMLDAIYVLLTEGGFNDLGLAFNLPFSRDGRLAIIDTEDYHKWPIPYARLNKYLSNKMQEYWTQLFTQGGPHAKIFTPALMKMMQQNRCSPPLLHSNGLEGDF